MNKIQNNRWNVINLTVYQDNGAMKEGIKMLVGENRCMN